MKSVSRLVRGMGFASWLSLSVGCGSSGSAPGGSAPGAGSSGGGSSSGSTGSSGGGSSSGGAGSASSGGTGSSSGGTGSTSGGSNSGGAGGSGSSTGGSSGGSSTSSSSGAGTSSSGGGSSGTGVVDSGAPPLGANTTLHVAGDSTACIFPPTDPTMRVGWASVFQQFFTTGVTIDDAALSGRSSKRFADEGHWATLKASIKAGDYVFIEFGHNDEKVGDTPRFTDPSPGCTGSACFRTYLTMYVTDSRAAGGFPVLLTPISRAVWSGNTIVATHVTAQGDYPAAVLAVGAATGTPVIDMTDRTRVWLEGLGPTAAIPMFAVGDTTHLSALGAPQVAELAVAGIRALALPIAARLK